ncbi:MAG: inner membrane protein [Fimbriimonadales bacterium]|nr:MAG: inner membrane protein [Fimbriimonadales bacterium]
MRLLLTGAGFLFVAIGTVGLFVPGLPTTIFVLMAAWCFAKSNPALERKLLEHPRLGPPILAWREDRSISLPHKILAVSMIGLSLGLTLALTQWAVWAKALLTLCCVSVALYLITRKTRAPHNPCPLRPEPKKQPEH